MKLQFLAAAALAIVVGAVAVNEVSARLQEKQTLIETIRRQEQDLRHLNGESEDKSKQLNEKDQTIKELETRSKDLEAKLQAKRDTESALAQKRSMEAVASAQTAYSGNCDLAYNYDWPKDVARAICLAESGGNPQAANWGDNHMSWAGCMGSFGLFQVNCSHGQLFDGAQNVAAAYGMWKSWNGFGAWSTYTNGAYLRFL